MKTPAVAIFASVLVLAAVTNASDVLQLSADVQGNSCEIADPGPGGIVTVHVLLRTLDATSVTFSAPVPASSGLTHVSDSTPYPSLGNSQSEVAIGLGTCETSGKILLMTMQFIRTSNGDPCVIYQPTSGYYSDCGFFELPIRNFAPIVLNADGTCSQAKHLSPADGATNVPLITALAWVPGYSCLLTGGRMVFFGTTPNPPQVAYDVESPYPVGPLEPGTKYYWRIADPGAGPVWSFTTTNSVSVRSSTWGAIKALYR